jgi:hypothetical protein
MSHACPELINREEYMKNSRKQTNLTKAARFVCRSLDQGQPHIAGTISTAVRRYQVSQHDLWMRLQSRRH